MKFPCSCVAEWQYPLPAGLSLNPGSVYFIGVGIYQTDAIHLSRGSRKLHWNIKLVAKLNLKQKRVGNLGRNGFFEQEG